jgi:hypothetical protein
LDRSAVAIQRCAVPHRRYPCEIEKIAVPMPGETTENAAAFALLGEPALASARIETVAHGLIEDDNAALSQETDRPAVALRRLG